MRSTRRLVSATVCTYLISLLAALTVGGCSSPPSAEPQASEATAQASSGDESAALGGGLEGEWCEYWALSGKADTQRYALSADGSFEWTAPEQGDSEVKKRAGRYAVSGPSVELTVVSEELRGPCAAESDCTRTLEPPKIETLELADCPPNEEARALDASYRCISLGGAVFWRRGR